MEEHWREVLLTVLAVPVADFPTVALLRLPVPVLIPITTK